MSKAKKILLSVTCAGLLVVGSVAATIAYLTSQDKVENTFTVGDVAITLDEAKVNPDGTEVPGAERVKENAYHLIPGQSYVKDPTVTVLEGSDESYVRMMVTVSDLEKLRSALPGEEYYGEDDVFLLQNLVNGWDGTEWVFHDFHEATGEYEFRYETTVAASDANVKLPALFEEIEMPGEIKNGDLAKLKGLSINVQAHAIQAAGFVNADEAWAKFN